MLYNFIWCICNYIPLSFWRIITTITSNVLVVVLKRDRAIALSQLNYVSRSQNLILNTRLVLKEAYFNSVLSVIELFIFPKITNVSKPITIGRPIIKSQLGSISATGLENVQEIIDNKSGAVCLSCHLSNFDLMTAFFTLQGLKLFVIARSANSKILHETLLKIRNSYGASVVWREDKKSITTLLKALKNNDIICSLIDQDVDLENDFCNFFGMPAAHPVGLIRLAIKFNKPILLTNIVRNDNMTFKINVLRMHWEKSEDPVRYILDSYTAWVENLVKATPGQWVWWHRRWRRRPGINYKNNPNMLLSTKDYINWIDQQS